MPPFFKVGIKINLVKNDDNKTKKLGLNPRPTDYQTDTSTNWDTNFEIYIWYEFHVFIWKDRGKPINGGVLNYHSNQRPAAIIFHHFTLEKGECLSQSQKK